MKKIILLMIFNTLIFISCGGSENTIETTTVIDQGDDPDDGNDNSNQWLIPLSQVRDGGPGRDGIPSIDNPKFLNVDEAPGLLRDEVRVVGIKIGNETRAYPHYILDWHEIVNDDLGSSSVGITYCPLTGSAIGWNRIVNGNKTTFGISGLLYNNNVIPFDRSTNSNWSQLELKCVNGDLIGQEPELIKVVETNWFIWKSMYPNTKILSTDTGFSRDYGVYPYGDYRSNNEYLIFPLSRDDKRLPRKERIHAIVDDEESKVYRFNTFSGGKAIKDIFNNKNILLVGGNETIVSFELDSQTSSLEFEYIFNESEAYFKDNEGTEWNVFGEAISGPRNGRKLEPTRSFIAYWFSIGAFYPGVEIFE